MRSPRDEGPVLQAAIPASDSLRLVVPPMTVYRRLLNTCGLGRLLNSSFLRNLSAVTLSKIATILLGLVTVGYAARALGPGLFGMYTFAEAAVAYVSILLLPGLVNWGQRAIAQDRPSSGRNLTIVASTRFVLSVVGYGCLVLFAFRGVDDSTQRNIIIVFGLSLLTMALDIEWVFGGLELMRVPALITVIVAAVRVMWLLALIKSPDDVLVYAAMAPALDLLKFSLGCFFLRSTPVRLAIPRMDGLRAAWWSALPLNIVGTMVILLHHANKLFVYGFLGPAELGIFGAAFRLATLATMFPALLASVFLPRLARIVQEQPEKAQREAQLYASTHMLIAFFIALLFFTESSSIVAIIYGESYSQSAALLRLLAVAVVFNYAICGYSNCLVSYNRDRAMIATVVASLIVSIGGGLFLVPAFGCVGAALAVCGIDLAGWLTSLPRYKKVVGSLNLRAWIVPIIWGSAAAGLVLFLQALDVTVWLRVPLAMVVYFPPVLHALMKQSRSPTFTEGI